MDVIEQSRARSPHFVWSDSVKVVQIPGQGNSVVCTKPIGPNQTIVRVPRDVSITIKTAQNAKAESDAQWTPHEVSAHESLERRKFGSDLWIESLPSNFDEMPIAWPASDREKAPKQARIAEQLQEVAKFAAKLENLFSHGECLWAWQAVNTRCVYWEQGGMASAPAFDYINHTPDTDRALLVESDFRGITVTTKRNYSEGEEVLFSYGPHDNAFSLVEYGFVLDSNRWDYVDVTKFVIRWITEERQAWLKERGYWQEYTIDRDGHPSFRTEVALAASQDCRDSVLNNFISGYDDGTRFEEQTQQILQQIANEQINELKKINTTQEPFKALIRQHIEVLETSKAVTYE